MPAHHPRRALMLAAAGLLACGAETSPPRALMARPEAAVNERVLSWLTCIDCTDGELESVLAAGDAGVDPLAVAAASGLPASVRAQARARALDVRLRTLGDSLTPGLPPMAQAEAEAEAQVERMVQVARGRAYLALGRLASVRALDVLERAAQDSATLSPFLRAVVRRARDSSPP